MTSIPENKWTWRRPLIWLLSIGGMAIAVFVVLKIAQFGVNSISALRDIALAALAESTIIVTLYTLGASSEYAKLIEATIKGFDAIRDNSNG